MKQQPKMTTDHRVIKKWIEERGGIPARVRDEMAAREESGVLRILFPAQQPSNEFYPLTWDKFFEKFDQAHLAFVYEEKSGDGEKSRFFKFMSLNGE